MSLGQFGRQTMDGYPATLLLAWKKAHESRARAGTAEAIKGEQDIQKHAFIEQMSDEQIEKAITRIPYSRARRPGALARCNSRHLGDWVYGTTPPAGGRMT
jgi:hypothetical protein